MQECFQNNNINFRFQNLQATMVGSYNNEIYLYDIKILCKGEPNISKECFGMLGWKLIKIKVDQCWRRFKESFHMVEIFFYLIRLSDLDYSPLHPATSPVIAVASPIDLRWSNRDCIPPYSCLSFISSVSSVHLFTAATFCSRPQPSQLPKSSILAPIAEDLKPHTLHTRNTRVFSYKQHQQNLTYLCIAAEVLYNNSSYLYSVIMLGIIVLKIGKPMTDSID
ncbi:hypothetical protein HID58_007056 [Brassica napus]|uniref:Uncharacterized protein n=1 Tax=Brassica napus TaxID=3708 RepID=A0ABQ8EG35_BRANA|nr:hypothetical protein HID58_007056 [Brassica napus]